MLFSIPLALGLVASATAQSSPAVVCVPGQCVQGFSNMTLGSKLSSPGSQTVLHLLPGQYTSTTNPQLLHDLLVSSSASLSSSAGLPSTLSLPLNLALAPGLAIFSDIHYSGQDAFSGLPTTPIGNTTLPVAAKSLALSENIFVAIAGSSNNDERVVLWESIPDISQITLSSSLNLLDIQSTSCSPACSGAGLCSATGQCVCPSNFAGSSCESCAPGFFGPQCAPCPTGCETCDEGSSGSGRCLSPIVGDNDPRKCNCTNGVCNPDGSCACNDGWVDGTDDKCSTCAAGFFLSSTGDCAVCQPGCLQCSAGTGTCNACRSGYTLNANDRTKCDPVRPVLSTGSFCPDNTFSAGTECRVCSSSCGSCSGPGDADCLTCAQGLFMNSSGRCVRANANGICEGSELVADNVKRTCDTCPSKCTSCGIANFGPTSTIDRLQCTQCLPGFVLSNGRCVDTCPAGTFVNPQDNLNCIPCSSSCSTCAGSADFCLSCPNNLLASAGTCVSTCPSGTFTATGACLPCHPDCASCSGPNFNQCSTCSPLRPVLSVPTGSNTGRCLPTCVKNQFFDATTRTCVACDGSCSSCSGAGPSKCLSCSSNRQVVRGNSCVDATCTSDTNVVPGLGICLSDLVRIPTATNGEAPLPTITGLGDPTKSKAKLEWWQILLMVLGCVFIFVAVIWCCRRRAKKQRAKKTILFAQGKGIDKARWKWGMIVAGWKALWTRKPKGEKPGKARKGEGELPIAYNHHEVTSRTRPVSVLSRTRSKEEIKMGAIGRKASTSNRRRTRDEGDLDSYIDAYDYSRRSSSIHSNTPSDVDGYYASRNRANLDQKYDRDRLRREVMRRERDLDENSMFSEITGSQRHTPEPRRPVKRDAVPIGFDRGSSSRSQSPVGKLRKPVLRKPVSDESLSEVVIRPHQSEGRLIDFDEGTRSQPLPSQQFTAAPFLSSIPVQTPVLSPAQTYAMSMAPDLIGGLNVPGSQPQQPGNTASFSSVSTGTAATVTGGAIGTTGGLYWLQPAGSDGGGGTNFVLKPALTGSSGQTAFSGASKNPFRI